MVTEKRKTITFFERYVYYIQSRNQLLFVVFVIQEAQKNTRTRILMKASFVDHK